MKRPLYFAAAVLASSFVARAQVALPPEHDAQTEDMHHNKPPVPASKSLDVTFQGRTVTLSIEQLQSLPQVTVRVHNAHRNTDEEYTGPLVADVLAKAGLVASKDTEPLILHSHVVATGTDKYFVLYSAAEMMPSFSTGKVIVAVMKAGMPDSEGGMIQLINSMDAKPARWVHGLASLNVSSMQMVRLGKP